MACEFATMTIDSFIPFIKGQEAYHLRQAERVGDDATRSAQHATLAQTFAALAHHLEKIQAAGLEPDAPSPRARYSKLGDISDLPPELRQQLSLSESDQLERHILDLAEEVGGEISVDEVLIGLYRRFKIIQQRKILVGKLSRMLRKGSLTSVTGRKGIYRIGDRFATSDSDEDEDDTSFLE